MRLRTNKKKREERKIRLFYAAHKTMQWTLREWSSFDTLFLQCFFFLHSFFVCKVYQHFRTTVRIQKLQNLHWTTTHIVRDICASCYFAGHCLRFDNIHSHRHTLIHTQTGADSHINASSLQLRNLRIPWGIVFDYGRQRGSLQEKFLGLGLRGSNGTGVLCWQRIRRRRRHRQPYPSDSHTSTQTDTRVFPFRW